MRSSSVLLNVTLVVSLVFASASSTRAEQDKIYLFCEGSQSNPSKGTPSVRFSEVDVLDLDKGIFYEAAHPNEEDWQRITSAGKDAIAWSQQGATFPPDGQWVQFTKSGTIDRNTGIGERKTVDGQQRVLELKTFKCVSGKQPF
jgi:hypothetical protein